MSVAGRRGASLQSQENMLFSGQSVIGRNGTPFPIAQSVPTPQIVTTGKAHGHRPGAQTQMYCIYHSTPRNLRFNHCIYPPLPVSTLNSNPNPNVRLDE